MESSIEIWKPINGYEGVYSISSLGKVKSMRRVSDQGYLLPEKLLKQGNNRGYRRVLLLKNRVRKNMAVHRLVAMHFIENPKNKPQVNHKNGIKNDNRVENLEWTTNSENIIHSYENGLQKPIWKNITGKDNPLSKNILQFSKNGDFIKEHIGINEVGRILKIDISSIIHNLKGRRKSAGGFVWKYKNESYV